jgi:hypothetical protein
LADGKARGSRLGSRRRRGTAFEKPIAQSRYIGQTSQAIEDGGYRRFLEDEIAFERRIRGKIVGAIGEPR